MQRLHIVFPTDSSITIITSGKIGRTKFWQMTKKVALVNTILAVQHLWSTYILVCQSLANKHPFAKFYSLQYIYIQYDIVLSFNVSEFITCPKLMLTQCSTHRYWKQWWSRIGSNLPKPNLFINPQSYTKHVNMYQYRFPSWFGKIFSVKIISQAYLSKNTFNMKINFII